MSQIFVMGAAMHKRPYVLNDGAPAPGYWAELLNGRGIPDNWVPPPHRVERKSSQLADCLGWVGGVPLLSARAVEVLSEVVTPSVAFRPFGEIKVRPYWVIGRVPVVDALDVTRSEINRSPSGEIMSLKAAVFLSDSVVETPPLFCLPGRAHCELFVREAVPAAVVAAGLTGFQFADSSQPSLRRVYLGEDINAFPGIKK